MVDERSSVFISYSHRDQRWLDEFLPFLKVYERDLGLNVWVDTHLPAGSLWMGEIQKALTSARVAVLLVSQHYLASNFIDKEEFRPILVANRRRGLKIIWVCLSACAYETSSIKSYQCAHNLAKPMELVRRSLRNSRWQNIAATVYKAFCEEPLCLTPPTGGGVRHDDPLYIDRRCDLVVESLLIGREFLMVLRGTRQMGKTSVIGRALANASNLGYKTVCTDCQRMTTDELTSDHLLDRLLDDLFEQLALGEPPATEFESLVRDHVLKLGTNQIVWVFDEAERLDHPLFFDLLAKWRGDRTRRGTDSPWSRMTFIMVYATEADLANPRLNRSPFTIGSQVTTDDLSAAEIRLLNQKHGSPLSTDKDILQFRELLGGHPYLSRVGLWELTDITLEELEQKAPLDDGPFASHLHYLQERIRTYPDLAEGVQKLLERRTLTEWQLYRLRCAGIACGTTPARARVRCRLYDMFLPRCVLPLESGKATHTQPR